MSKIKAVIDFNGYSAADLAPVGQIIHDQMLANAATFGSPPVTMPALTFYLSRVLTMRPNQSLPATAATLFSSEVL